MRRLLCVALVVLGTFSFARGQDAAKNNRRPELFTNYIGATTPLFTANIPAAACRSIIVQADKIQTSPDGLEPINDHDLQVASLNLRICATSQLARVDRDLAVGLYGEVVSELERRERSGK